MHSEMEPCNHVIGNGISESCGRKLILGIVRSEIESRNHVIGKMESRNHVIGKIEPRNHTLGN